MPHNGYRAFDPIACRTAFPDFSFVPLQHGLLKLAEVTPNPVTGATI
jgi:hypothetical protein